MQRTFFYLCGEQIVESTIDEEDSTGELSIDWIETVAGNTGDESIEPAVEGPGTRVRFVLFASKFELEWKVEVRMGLQGCRAPDLVSGNRIDLLELRKDGEHQTGITEDTAVHLGFDGPAREANAGGSDSLSGLFQELGLLSISPVPSNRCHATDDELFLGEVQAGREGLRGGMVKWSRGEWGEDGGLWRHGGKRSNGVVLLYTAPECSHGVGAKRGGGEELCHRLLCV